MSYLRIVATCFCIALIPAAQYSAAALPQPIDAALKRARIPASNAAFLVMDAKSGKTLLAHNADTAMSPASVMKVVTTAAAFDLLSPSFTWRTEFLTAEAPNDGILTSPLYIKASGDPKITWEDLERVFERLRGKGITSLRGGIVVDRRIFAPQVSDPAAFDNRALRPYNVLPDAMLFNFKAVGFKFVPDAANQRVNLMTEPNPEGLTIDANIRLTRGACGDWRTKLQARFDDNDNIARAQFSGTFSAECGEREWFVSLLSHDAFLEGSLRWLWKKVGGTELGAIRPGVVPVGAQLLDAHFSQPITAAINDVNKFSNNVMARHLLLTIDATRATAPATPEGGARKIAAWLKRENIAAPELVIDNGSGLSRRERISANTLGRVLQLTTQRPYASVFLQSLPLAAIDGTLKNRFTNSAASGSAHLKTGSIDDVRTLAGILQMPDGRSLIYVAMLNHPYANAAQSVLDAGVEWAYAHETR